MIPIYTQVRIRGRRAVLLPLFAFFWLLAGGAGCQAQSAARAPLVQGQPMDINRATAAELKSLPGMGDAYAKRVIDGRPYTAKNQLVTRGILPQAAYDRIRDLIVAHRLPATQ